MAGNFYQVSDFLVNQSLATTFTSPSFFIGSFDHVSIQKVVTAASSLNGSLQLEKSVDGTSWDTQGSPISLTGNVVNITQIADVQYGYIRYVYTSTSGTGTLNIKIGTVNHGR